MPGYGCTVLTYKMYDKERVTLDVAETTSALN